MKTKIILSLGLILLAFFCSQASACEEREFATAQASYLRANARVGNSKMSIKSWQAKLKSLDTQIKTASGSKKIELVKERNKVNKQIKATKTLLAQEVTALKIATALVVSLKSQCRPHEPLYTSTNNPLIDPWEIMLLGQYSQHLTTQIRRTVNRIRAAGYKVRIHGNPQDKNEVVIEQIGKVDSI
ncbi:MAG: hypothetical protein IT292_11640 [Deltaproteobacteria bacterium]|nr:hypothetical protein [Deltaproteobacteria bacterium]